MGTDVFLSWDGMSEELKQAQGPCNIDSGRIGFLRASIMMEQENQILKKIFPDHWDYKKKDFKFNQVNYKKLFTFLPVSEEEIRQAYTSTIVHQIDLLFGIKVKLEPKAERMIIFLNSLIDFFKLGMEKEKEGLNPKIYISY